ncbi:MAG: SAM-dependent methyltransferase [Sphingomonadales bacterium 35-56-22]|jgi:16S rRNA (cytosine967-C5)-methyltransferase|uniref:RsmB/NOP family class I SAM-dependent RNA methyltransferase n=1 Tax=Sphingorhabdus sp. TaxID=1902408 RepID=UPI000BD26362|nr:transcription antitermination factor NusB [Sphingorhabdus sp.]OYY15159.1 MAG: SAM-dependent methyltransferase [Sphingomonadales bacterium 35-56-22]OYY97424.1 MAG: SAM-dependent methyltransferase [Sphingomonadales bacterium 28-56-43]OYZ60186.1 MAG: SAM-dependent methyltransferase [Sphingomonadales bacterium 24-56-14]OZA82456.1 MAG: SAM-dependent methyltransferase [Sphingomonadales bacterium 39-57-19]HQS13277.1 transcription antitermination factor NusB [Sphingorhabdus sp.]
MTEEISGLPTRRAALRLLDTVMRMGTPLDQATANATKGLSPSDRALAIAIAQETLRWSVDLDQLIDSKTKQPLPDDAKARMVLRLALAQILRLGTPAHAAIATALPLVDGGPRRLVHGVLGSLLRAEATLPDLPSLPEAVMMRWHPVWGDEMIAGAQAALSEPPPLDLALRDPSATQAWAERLGGVSLMPGHVRLPRGTAIEELDGYDEGAWWVQDLAASLPARLLGDGQGKRALDLCAAPGGKTMQLSAAGFTVTALDNSARRMDRLMANLERTQLNAERVNADVMDWKPAQLFDAILLDAPCSATGTMRRHPDVLQRIDLKAINNLAAIQSAMLDRAAQWLKPGGTLVFATCSLEPHEGEAQAEAFLARQPEYTTLAATADELPAGVVANAHGHVRTMPPMLADQGGLDGFFVARFLRAG